MWQAGESSIGGIMPLADEARQMGAPPHWMAYIGTPDTDATVARAQELGARLMAGPMDIPTVGRFAVLLDPFGAVFAAFTPEEGPEGDKLAAATGIGHFTWKELMTRNAVEALAFYGELFGWEQMSEMDMGPEGVYRMYGVGGDMLGGMMDAGEGRPVAWLYYARVPSIEDALLRVRDNGGTVLHGPMEVPGGDLVAQCMDPQGAAFALHEVKGS
jgi:predicted enzyme related to lactoylglutathione lyase